MTMLESLLVTLIVIACAGFSTWRLLSARLRLRLLGVVAAALGNPAQGWLARLRRKALAELAGGCGACSHGGQGSSSISEVFPHANRKSAAPRR